MLRKLPLIIAFFPSLVLADEITLQSQVTAAVLYPQGAKIVRRVPFEAPAGSNELRLLDLPEGTPLETIRVKVSGVEMGAITLRRDFVPPAPERENDAVKAAKAEVERLQEAVQARADEASAIRTAKEAADTRIAFLRQLGQGETLSGASADTLRDVSRMIGEETQAAREAALTAEARARAVDREKRETAKALEKAKQALAALVPENDAHNLVAVAISSDAPAKGTLEVSYYDWRAGWQPVYDASLDRVASKITLERGAMVRQTTGENWRDVALTLSTNAPEDAVQPTELYPEKHRIMDPPKVQPLARMKTMDAVGAAAPEPIMEAPVARAEMTASVRLDGLNVSYDYPETLDLASSADQVRLGLGAVSFDATIKAVAVPKRDKTAFLVATFTNSSGELILPSVATQLFRDDAYVGQTASAEAIPSGGEATLAFGPIEGLTLNRVSTRNEGDRGVLSKSNELTEKVRIEVKNLTGESWPLRVLDQVPYSEQEDLVITWNAKPRPDETDVDDKKGVLAWDSTINAGETQVLNLNYSLEWPDGKLLR
ncbi:mucoidy inhibitor MuiA family protein [Aquicoccus sp. G2-2]|uniref:DUF4139 domain-containing protein n=1 Tax=Aquicoccus sp. G2-2 TaxID=3092120 RepID=UPI002AE06D5F|nr:mucoidy inhibitor MuiA family protein [Aquicoccus sp. G2-2]MEA1114957.1 mucoidy inhibitor MuiA family protein [Aquicoccus sp. G2-2]